MPYAVRTQTPRPSRDVPEDRDPGAVFDESPAVRCSTQTSKVENGGAARVTLPHAARLTGVAGHILLQIKTSESSK